MELKSFFAEWITEIYDGKTTPDLRRPIHPYSTL